MILTEKAFMTRVHSSLFITIGDLMREMDGKHLNFVWGKETYVARGITKKLFHQIFRYVGQGEVSLLSIREAFSLLKSTFISSLLKTCNGINQSTLEYSDSNAAYK